jgi:hypothetical protein
MRPLLVMLALPLFALQAHAQTAPPQPPATAPVAAASSPTAKAPALAAMEHHRMTWQQRFAQANLAHDGHLTAQEASGGFPSVARHFQEIDADKKGFVTEEDITNWHKLQRAMHHSTHARTDEGLRPRPAMQQGLTEPPQIRRTSTDSTVLPMTQPDAQPAGQQATAK